jgi:hypothetical protein
MGQFRAIRFWQSENGKFNYNDEGHRLTYTGRWGGGGAGIIYFILWEKLREKVLNACSISNYLLNII